MLLKNTCDFTDFFYEDVEAVINVYPLSDLITKTSKSYSIKETWSALIDKLVKTIDVKNIKLNTKVTHVVKKDNIFSLKTNDNQIYQSKKLILCGDLDITKIQFSGINGINDFYNNNIGSIHFIRIYTYHDKVDIKNNIRTTSPLNKIIPISKNIVMAAYADNDNATFLYDLVKKLNKEDLQKYIGKMLNKSLLEGDSVTDIKDFMIRYWSNGIHYYKPGYNINQDKLVEQGVLVCGEAVSQRQGWCEGAFQNVDDSKNLFEKLIKQ